MLRRRASINEVLDFRFVLKLLRETQKSVISPRGIALK
jgi:hypothetical protein